ncbi:Actin, adductor muscle [Thelohanellus kitauei]|uniref:Actin, adductor muscle n=1 Tax=Thelohanellus kitauei TaxID=669202 RepID=A0A0C2MZT4_THEKT|nr:Actin, adductor muscle [Thelohanellus kitauei]
MEDCEGSFRSIILDNGSGTCKVGFSGQSMPIVEFPTIVAEPKHKNLMTLSFQKDYFLGHEASKKRGIVAIKYPVKNGVVIDWDGMERIWEYIYRNELRVVPEQYPVLITDTPFNPKTNRERMAQIFFERFHSPGLYISLQAALAIYSNGLTTGLVLDSGDGVTHTVPIVEGYSISHAIKRMDLAGRDLTDYLIKLLRESGHNFISSSQREIARDMKEKLCYVAVDYKNKIMGKMNEKTYQLPDGQLVSLDSERLRCPELLFQPSLDGYQMPGIHESVYESIQSCDIDSRQSLYSKIVLSGGSTLFPGMRERLAREIKQLAPVSVRVDTLAPAERKYSVWKGGSLLGSLSTFQQILISKAEYDEFGPSIVHKKCP